MASYSKIYKDHEKIIRELAKQHFYKDEPNSKKYACGLQSLLLVYTILSLHRTFGSQNGYYNQCSFSMSGLATRTGLGKAAVQKAISLLEEAGIITTEKGAGYNNVTLFGFPSHDKYEKQATAKQGQHLAEVVKNEGVKSFRELRDIKEDIEDNQVFKNSYTGKNVSIEELRRKYANV